MAAVKLDRDALAQLLPHAGAMCLLDEVTFHDDARIVCISAQHANPDNPLAVDGRLASVHGIEFAAQAMAVHAALCHGENRYPSIGWLASIRDCVLHSDRLDSLPVPLCVSAERVAAAGGALMYDFSIAAGDTRVLEGRATVALVAPAA